MSPLRYAAIYARISTDKQSELSPESQIRKCREDAEARGFRILEAHIYRDDGISGTSMERPAFQQMIAAAVSPDRPFDAIFVDDTSRLSRSTEDALTIFRRMNFAGVQLIAVSQAIDSHDEQADLLVTVHGLVDSLYVKELAKKVHRGLDERVLRGLHAGGRCFGYVTVEASGGKKVSVNESEAETVRRIFQLSADGSSLRTIAKTLNAEGIPPPRPRKGRFNGGWCPTAIREMLRNERYIGRTVWNRSRFVKVPGTNRRIARPRPQTEWRVFEWPEQRIISDKLWSAVATRQRWVNEAFGNGNRAGFLVRNASSPHLFSGLLYCAECGGRLTIICGHGKMNHRRYGCSRNFYRGTCSNRLRDRQDRVEARLLEGLQRTVLQPEVVEYTLERFEEELARHAATMSGGLEQLRTSKVKLERELRNLTATAAQTGPSDFLVHEISSKEKELGKITDQLLDSGSNSGQTNRAELRQFVHSHLADMRRISYVSVERARAQLARHVTRIEMRPVMLGRKGYYVAAGEWNFLGTAQETDRAPHLWGGGARMVAGVGFEPTTSGL